MESLIGGLVRFGGTFLTLRVTTATPVIYASWMKRRYVPNTAVFMRFKLRICPKERGGQYLL